MTVKIYWQLDVAAEPARLEANIRPVRPAFIRDARTPALNRYDYYAQIGRAAAQTAFDGLFLPFRPESDDSQIVAAAIAREVPRLELVPQFPASIGSAVYAVKQAVSFQRLAHDRLGWAIASDADGETRARAADHLPEEQLGARIEEFLRVSRGVHGTRPFSFKGQHFEVQGGGFEDPLARAPFPSVFFEGESEEALTISARLADVHLFRDAPFETLRALIEALDGLASAEVRTVEFGVIHSVVAREDTAEAQDDAALAGAPASAIIGSYAEVARELNRRAALGVTRFVLAGTPSLEEAYRIGQHVLPRLRALLRADRAAA